MGIASQDLTGDGYPEVYLTSQGDNKLQTLADGPAPAAVRGHRVASRRHRPPAVRRGGHPAIDGLAPGVRRREQRRLHDLYVAKGNVEAQTEYAMKDPSNLLIGQPDGTFVEAAEEAGLLDFGRARGAAVVDLNVDGPWTS